MAGLMHTALKRLLPTGRALKFVGQGEQVLEALGTSLERPKEFLRSVQDEALPYTATNTIDEWLELFGIAVPSDTTLEEKRKIAAEAIAAIGGQSIDYINSRIQAVFPNVYIVENTVFTYNVLGFYPYARDFSRIQAIIARTAPLHLVPNYQTRSVYDGDVARCGIGTTGREITGRSETAYSSTDGQIARCGVGVVGIEITGRIPV